ncbi:MAG: CDP-alcohol phosphatidyltransferase family protein [Sphingomonadales bacterium]|nr:CDP-alcohol phosphatidyltransferase family protein [Sphingomonadales bacterium]
MITDTQTGNFSRAAARAQRPRELEDALNFHLYHPLAWRLAQGLARTPMTPNLVSVVGAGFVIAAAVAYAQPWWPVSALLGMMLHMTWHVVDGADGDLARLTGRVSPVGEMVDGICDYVGHVVLYLVLGWLLQRQIGASAWPLAIAAGISHVIQTNHVEVQRRSYQWWVYGKSWLGITHRLADAPTRARGLAGFASFYLGVAAGVAGSTRLIDEAVADAASDPERRARITELARAEAPPLLRLLKVLGPNPRAIVLGLSMLAHSPVWYFAWEVVVLNVLLVGSVQRHNAAARRILAAIGR